MEGISLVSTKLVEYNFQITNWRDNSESRQAIENDLDTPMAAIKAK